MIGCAREVEKNPIYCWNFYPVTMQFPNCQYVWELFFFGGRKIQTDIQMELFYFWPWWMRPVDWSQPPPHFAGAARESPWAWRQQLPPPPPPAGSRPPAGTPPGQEGLKLVIVIFYSIFQVPLHTNTWPIEGAWWSAYIVMNIKCVQCHIGAAKGAAQIRLKSVRVFLLSTFFFLV